MSTTPIQYLLLNAVSVCYSPYYIANVFLKKEIAQVIEIRTHHNTNISVLDEDPQFWYQKCTQSVLLQVRWMDTEAAFKFIQSIRDANVVVNETLWYEDDEPKTVVVYPTATSQPWFALEGNLNNFHYEYPRHIIWTNPEYQVNINKKYHPISICLLFTDIEKKIHIKLRKYKIPLITAGHINNINFVDNFYKMISLFKYAAAPKTIFIGSSFFYCIDFGMPYFFIGKKDLKYMNLGNFLKDKVIKINSFYDKIDRKKMFFLKKKFNKPNELLLKKEQILITRFLGKDSNINRLQFSLILWKNFFINLHIFLSVFLKEIIKKILMK
jgi:hypothetical protein